MDINIVGRNLGITDRFREYAEEKAEKVAHLADRAFSLDIKASRHHEPAGPNGNDRVELTLIGPGPLVRAEASGPDKYAAFDLALGRLLERIRRAKDRKKMHRSGHRRPASLQEATTGGFSVIDITPASADALTGAAPAAENAEAEEEEYCPVVIRTKVFPTEPMSVDDALYHMELVGHDFYLFVDRETSRPSVVYRRKGWDYGVIGLDTEAHELQEASGARKRSR